MTNSHHITTVEQLQRYLVAAMELEHATIPPYITALYSIHPGTNSHATHVLRVVAVEEMLHLTLAANLLNAVGGTPDLTAPDFVPTYPAYLPDGEDDFQVGLAPMSRDSLETFLKIERPAEAPGEEVRLVPREDPERRYLAHSGISSEWRFYSIGDFYKEIRHGIDRLHDEIGDALFSGDPARQVGAEYYYSGGGELTKITDLASAREAIRVISEQGEGLHGAIFDVERELSHYFRFQQLLLGHYYQPGDEAGKPSGPALEVDWEAAYPVKPNVRLSDLPEGSELHAGALAFNHRYAEFLAELTRAFTGQPELLIEAVAGMFHLRNGVTELMHNPIPGTALHAGPTFEVAAVAGGVPS